MTEPQDAYEAWRDWFAKQDTLTPEEVDANRAARGTVATDEKLSLCCRCFTLSCSWAELQAGIYVKDGVTKNLIDAKEFSAYVEPIGEFWKNPSTGFVYKDIEVLYRCTKLGDDGRCTIYNERLGVCRKFNGGNNLCEGCTNEDCKVQLGRKFVDEVEIDRMWRS